MLRSPDYSGSFADLGTGYFMGWLHARKFSLRKEAPEGWYPLKQAMPEFAEDLKVHAQAVAAAAGRPYQPLASGQDMEENARELAQHDGIAEGLVCVYSVQETGRSFRVAVATPAPGRAGPARLFDPLLLLDGSRIRLIHVKIQTWFPFTVQVYVNGHEWLARKLAGRDRLSESGQCFRLGR